MPSFVSDIARENGVRPGSTLFQYLERKTKAVDRGSKARRSLGNLYALYVLCEAFVEGHTQGTQFTTLLSRMKELPFGSKLQNHPLDNRLNDEVSRQYGVPENTLPVQSASLSGGRKSRKISVPLLQECDTDPNKAAQFVIDVIDRYVEIISDNQTAYLNEIESAKTSDEIAAVVSQAFVPEADARLFEIVSYALLHMHFGFYPVTTDG